MTGKKVPSTSEFHMDLMVDVMSDGELYTRTEIAEMVEEKLEESGYQVIPKRNDDGTKNYTAEYYRIHNAISRWKSNYNGTYKGIDILTNHNRSKTRYSITMNAGSSSEDNDQSKLENKDNMDNSEKIKTIEPLMASSQASVTKSRSDTEESDTKLNGEKQMKNVYVDTDKYDIFKNLMFMGFHILAIGPPGVGKTNDAQRYAHEKGYDLKKIVLTRESAEWSLIGRSNLIITYEQVHQYARLSMGCRHPNGNCEHIRKASTQIMKSTWIDGAVTEAVRNASKGNKTLLLIDEVNFGDQSVVAGVLNSILELTDPSLTVKDTSEELSFDRDNLKVVATLNPDTVGTSDLNEALKSRFIKLRYGLPDNYAEIATKHAGRKPSNQLIRVFNDLRSAKIRTNVALREIIQWNKLELLGPIADSDIVKDVIVDQFEPGEQKTVKEIIKTRCGSW